VRLVRTLAVANVVGAWAVIVIGGYVTATNAGLSCENLIECGPASLGAETEISHRLAAWIEGFLVLGLLVVVLRSHRAWLPVRNLTLLSFGLVVLQALIGMVSVYAGVQALPSYPFFVTAHLGIATVFLAVCVWNAATILRGTPPATVGVPASPTEGTAEGS
jgi:heme A synthase